MLAEWEVGVIHHPASDFAGVLWTDQSVQQLAQRKGLLAGWLLEAVDAAPEPTANPESIR